MPLINCKDCGKVISDQAVSCPNCGRPLHTSQPIKVEDTNAKGLFGKPGTFNHTLNIGCLGLIIVIAILYFINKL